MKHDNTCQNLVNPKELAKAHQFYVQFGSSPGAWLNMKCQAKCAWFKMVKLAEKLMQIHEIGHSVLLLTSINLKPRLTLRTQETSSRTVYKVGEKFVLKALTLSELFSSCFSLTSKTVMRSFPMTLPDSSCYCLIHTYICKKYPY